MSDLPVFDNYEISGCRRFNEDEKEDRQFTEACDDADAQFWTLYGHINGQGVETIGDFPSREAAEEVFFRITGEPFTGSCEANPRLRMMHASRELLAACQMVVTRWERGDLAEAARLCQTAVESAIGDGISSDLSPAKQPSRFELEHDPLENPDLAYVLVDGRFDVRILRTSERIVIDVYPKDWIDPIDSLTVWDEEVSDASAEAETDETVEA